MDAVEREYGRLKWTSKRLDMLESGRTLLAETEQTQVSSAVVAAARALDDYIFFSPGTRILSTLSRRRLEYRAEDMRLLLSLATSAHDRTFPWLIAPIVSIAEGWSKEHGTGGVQRELRRLLASVVARRVSGYDHERTALAGRLRVIIGDDRPDLSVFDEQDDFGRRARRFVSRLDPGGLAPLVAHLASASSSRPSGVWQDRAVQLVEAARDGEALLRGLLEQAVEADLRKGAIPGTDYSYFGLEDANATLLRGALWVSASLERPWALPLTMSILERVMKEPSKVTNACIYSLGALGTSESLAVLSQARTRVKDRGVLKQIDRALEGAAERAGMSRSELRETLVSTLGLDKDSSRTTAIGDAMARVKVVAPGRVTTRWSKHEQVLGGAPAAVKTSYASELRALQAEVRNLREAVANERRRIEDLFSEERIWQRSDWHRLYLEHPLLRPLSKNLIWTFDGRAGLATNRGLVGDDYAVFEPAERAQVRLWHPIDASPEEVTRWRSFLLENELVQPFKQAHREVYLLAPAEEETRTYSNRFAAHILHYPQTFALIKERGWSGNALGPCDGGYESTVFRDFGSQGIRAEFFLQMIESEQWVALAELASTDQVRFRSIRHGGYLPLTEVPAIVFSEAMRDVDMFVGVSSIAADPEWIDRGETRFDDYWRRTAYGGLTQSAVVRRELLVELLPRLKIADCCQVEDRFLTVRGRLRTYRIHLGSGNILMAPNDQYLCIVPARRERSQPRLPFEGDDRLSVILSKAFLLADDHRIRDQTILRQISR